MTEVARTLTPKETIDLIRSHIAVRLDGGPNRKKEDVELGRSAGLPTEMISTLWDDAEKQVQISLPSLEVVVKPQQMDEERPASKRRSLPPDPDEKASEKKKAEAFFKNAEAQPAAVEAKTTPEPEEPKPKPKDEKGPSASTSEARAMLPAVVVPTSPVAPGWDDAVAVMNEHHAIIDNVGGKAVIAGWEPSSLDPSRLEVVFQNKESFLLRYSNRYAMINVPNGMGGGQQVSV